MGCNAGGTSKILYSGDANSVKGITRHKTKIENVRGGSGGCTGVGIVVYCINSINEPGLKTEPLKENLAPGKSPDWRFRVQIENPKLINHDSERKKYEIIVTFDFHSLMVDKNERAHVFLGYTEVLDDRLIPVKIKNRLQRQSCWKLEECRTLNPTPQIHGTRTIWDGLIKNPLPIFGGIGPDIPPQKWDYVFEIPDDIERFGIWWAFYQKEGQNNSKCQIDHSREHSEDQIPYLKMVSVEGKTIEKSCFNDLEYRSFHIKKIEGLGGTK